MSDRRTENMKRLNGDPVFRSARDDRAQKRLSDPDENQRLQRLSNIAKRGCDVPPWLEDEWTALKQTKLSNRDAAAALRIPWLGDPEDTPDAGRVAHKICAMIDELIRIIEAEPGSNTDFAYRVIEHCKRIKSVVART